MFVCSVHPNDAVKGTLWLASLSSSQTRLTFAMEDTNANCRIFYICLEIS